MDIFDKLFNLAATRKDGVVTNADINNLAKQHQETGITLNDDEIDSKFVQPIRTHVEFFNCYSCKCTLQILPHQESVFCAFCEKENAVMRVDENNRMIGIAMKIVKPSELTTKGNGKGKTTDDDDIIDISYEEVPPTSPKTSPSGEYHIC